MRVALAVTALALGCSPNIHGFRAEPNVVCGGGRTTLMWSASTDGALSAVPADPSLGSVEANGTRAVTPAAPTTYRLTVKRFWKSISRDVGVEVVMAPGEARQIGASVADPSATCADGTLAVTVTAPASAWDPHIQVTTVGLIAGVNRTFRVEHGGRSAEVAPGAPSAAFAGLPVQGDWRLSTALVAPEACGRNVPRSLIIDVASACAR
jgi:hypothetical protein